MNDFMNTIIVRLKQEQDVSCKQISSWKSLVAAEDKTINERAQVISILESNKNQHDF